MQKLSPLVLAMGAISFAAVPVQFTSGTAAKADDVNRNFTYLDSAKADRSTVTLLGSAVNAKLDIAEATTKLGAKVDTATYGKYVREQAAKTISDTAAKRRIDSLASATKTGNEGLGKRLTTLEAKPGSISNDTAGMQAWTSANFTGTVPVAGIKSQGPTDYGSVAFMRRDLAGGTSVLDVHTDGVFNSWSTNGGIQTNSVTRIDGSGNGFLSSLQIGSATKFRSSALSIQPTGTMWDEGIEILPSSNGWSGLFLRAKAGSMDSSWSFERTNNGNLVILRAGLATDMSDFDNSSAALGIHPNGDAAFGRNLTVKGTLTAKTTALWPDYAFEPGYKAMALKDVETFAKANGHLPEVPSAAEVAKDGIDLAKMNAILLKKIEELTLHAVAQEKRMEAQQARMETLQSKVEALERK